MTVKTTAAEYIGEVRDRVENFNGNQLVYVGWDHHLMFCSAFTLMMSPDTTFQTLRDEMLPELFDQHPEWSEVNWETTEWNLNGEPFVPSLNDSLYSQGIDHKSLLRFNTPELKGFMGAGV